MTSEILVADPFKRRPARMHMPECREAIAYIAGLFDGEGCITRTNHRPIVQVGMTDQGVIEWLGKIGGTIRREQPSGNRKPLFRWRLLAANDVECFLRAIYPYLRVKAAAAENAIVEIEGQRLLAMERLPELLF